MDAGSSSNAYSLSQSTQDNMKVVLGSLVGKNPYRILGVYANATSKEMQKNLSRISAFAKVGRSEGFPTDFSAAFRVASALMRVEFESAVFEPRRDEAAVAAAQAQCRRPFAAFVFLVDVCDAGRRGGVSQIGNRRFDGSACRVESSPQCVGCGQCDDDELAACRHGNGGGESRRAVLHDGR